MTRVADADGFELSDLEVIPVHQGFGEPALLTEDLQAIHGDARLPEELAELEFDDVFLG